MGKFLTKGYPLLITIAIVFSFASATPAQSEVNDDFIDEETAVKLAILASYHKEYSDADGLNHRVYPFTDRAFVDSIDLQTLDGEKEYYAISLSRNQYESKPIEELSEGLSEWLDFAAGRLEKVGDGEYEIYTGDWEFLQSWLTIYGNWNDYRGYYNCVVPKSKSDGFLFGFHKGLSQFTYLAEIAKRALQKELETGYDTISLIYAAPSKEFLFEANGDKHIVTFPEEFGKIPIEIYSGAAADDFLAGYEPNKDSMFLDKEVDIAASTENIEDWLRYVDITEENGGFPVPGEANYKIINEVLAAENVPALSDGLVEGEGSLLDPTDMRSVDK